MKLRLPNLIHLEANAMCPILISLWLIVVSTSMPLHAQRKWELDSQHSIARLSLGSGPNTLEIGLARVSGDVVFDMNDSADPSVTLKITPGSGPTAEYPEIRFTSERSWITGAGKLIVAGELSVTRIERNVTMESNEAYAGPQYGEPVVHTDTRQITLAFSESGPFKATDGVATVTATTSDSREDFPQLLEALKLEAWPTMLVNDHRCEDLSTIGEDYAGVRCTGTVIASVSSRLVPTGGSGGEGYSGFESEVAPDLNHATIVLDLQLKEQAVRASQNER